MRIHCRALRERMPEPVEGAAAQARDFARFAADFVAEAELEAASQGG